ncbi:hypothetical protein [uncultured Methylobacterium sp.]|uniref:helix-turn-helix transcriptional regulator n=1 Tax=uncultured Methylobacterium sp. TaxID=157278 RepID=UPI0026021416|nr:hypothetical protein [uncultured Methylobacterium sp.]
MSLNDKIHQLVLDIHATALGDGTWIGVAARAAEQLGAYGVTMVLHGIGEVGVISSAMAGYRDLDFDNILCEYAEQYHFRNPQALYERARPKALYYLDGADPLYSPENFQDFSRWEADRIGIRYHATGYCRPTEDITFAFAFSGSMDTGPFSPKQIDLFRLLMSHMRQAVSTADRLRSLQNKVDDLRASFDNYLENLTDAALTVDVEGRSVFANSKAVALVREGDGISIRGGIVTLLRADENRAFQHLCASAGRLVAGDPIGGGTQKVSRPSGRRPYHVEVRVLTQSEALGATRPAVALVIIRDLERQMTVAPQHLTQLFGLTPGEARVAVKLFEIGHLDMVAEANGVSLATVRVQLKRIFAKTETARQSELVSLLARLAR